MILKNPFELLTADELMEIYPNLSTFLNWNPRNLSSMFSTKTIMGKWNNSIKCYEYRHESVIRYIDLAKANVQQELEWLNNPFRKR